MSSGDIELRVLGPDQSCAKNQEIFDHLFAIILDDCLTILECPVVEIKSTLGTQLDLLTKAATAHRDRISELGQNPAPIAKIQAEPRPLTLKEALGQRSEQIGHVLALLQSWEMIVHDIWDAPSKRLIARTILDLADCLRLTEATLEAIASDLKMERLSRKVETANWRPARDARFAGEKTPPKTKTGSHEATIIRVCHITLMGTEIPTIEACADLILDFHDTGWDFVVDMARQAWDEARHADAFIQKIIELGGTIGAYPCDSVLWEMSRQDSLALRLCIHQRIGEWIGIDAAMGLAEDLRKKDDISTAMLLDYVARDEITHVTYGNRWIKRLLPDEAAVLALHEQAEEIRTAHNQILTASNFPLMIDMCKRSGMSNREIERLAEKHGFTAEVAAQ